MGCWLVGPRLGRFDSNGNPVDMPGHSATLVVLGTVLLWFGWFGFNPGSTLIITSDVTGRVAARAAVCTCLSGCAGGIACLINGFRRQKVHACIRILATRNGCAIPAPQPRFACLPPSDKYAFVGAWVCVLWVRMLRMCAQHVTLCALLLLLHRPGIW
jgi:ammonia channel protein AmtB